MHFLIHVYCHGKKEKLKKKESKNVNLTFQ